MSSTEIKSVIGLLCKQLNLLLNVTVKPEHFRLAKFDLTEENVVGKLWRTLSLLTSNEENTDIAVVKDYMSSINYASPLFYSLPEDVSEGSRELLLAIGFIIARDLRNFIMEEISKSPFGDSCRFIDDNIPLVCKPEIPNISNEEDVKNFLNWIKGRMKQNQNLTKEYEAQTTKIYDKLRKSLSISTVDKLCLYEVVALSNKKHCKEFLEKSSFILELLQCYQEWTRKEKIFWKWMVTVLAERERKYL